VLDRAVAVHHRHAVVLLDPPVDQASDDQPAHVVVPVQRGGAELQALVLVHLRRGHGGQQRVEERDQRAAVVVEGALGDALARVGVDHWELELILVGVQVDEQVVHLVQHLSGARVLAVDLVDDHHRGEAGFQRLLEHEARLGQGALGRVDEQEDAVHQGEGALHLAAEVGVARGVDDVDLDPSVVHGGVLGHDRDALLPLEVDGVHDPLHHVLVGAEDAGLPEHGVHQGGLAVVDVGNDGDVADIGALRHEVTLARIVASLAACRGSRRGR
jgi:hypothetical protein